jgi:ankyrin repeat protein
MDALVEYGANIDCLVTETKITPLIMVASVGHLELTKWLLDKGADPNAASPLNGSTPIMLAAKYGHPKCIAEIMRKKGAISAKDVSSNHSFSSSSSSRSLSVALSLSLSLSLSLCLSPRFRSRSLSLFPSTSSLPAPPCPPLLLLL